MAIGLHGGSALPDENSVLLSQLPRCLNSFFLHSHTSRVIYNLHFLLPLYILIFATLFLFIFLHLGILLNVKKKLLISHIPFTPNQPPLTLCCYYCHIVTQEAVVSTCLCDCSISNQVSMSAWIYFHPSSL